MLAVPWMALAESTLTAPNGWVFRFGEWSKPSAIVVESTAGPVPLIGRTCDVAIQSRRWTQNKQFQLLFDPGLKEVWLGDANGRYLVSGQKIWGAAVTDSVLMIRTSDSAGDAANGQELQIEEVLKRFLVDPRSLYWSAKVKGLALQQVFGSDAVSDLRSQASQDRKVTFSSIVVAPNGVTVNLTASHSGEALSVRLNEKVEIVEASRGGAPWPVVRSSFAGSNEFAAWFPPIGMSLPSPQGAVSGLRFLRFYTAPDESGEPNITLGSAYAVLVPATGDLWIGPALCAPVVIDRRMLGIVVDTKAGEIQVFSGPRARLPLSEGTAQAFADQLRQFESGFIAGGYRFQPDWKASLPGLFAGDDRFANGCKFNLYRVSVQGNAIVLNMTSSNPNAHPEVTLSPDLKTISTRVLDPGEFGKLERSQAWDREF